MIRFHQTFGAHAGRVLTFDQDVVRFGRMPDSDFAFDPNADLDASGRHAEVRRQAGRWMLFDSGSRNGTYVAGQRISQHPLSDGEEIEFGPGGPRVRVEMVTAQPAAPRPARPDAYTLEATDVDPAFVTDPEADTMMAPAFPTPSIQPPPPTQPPPPNRLPAGVAATDPPRVGALPPTAVGQTGPGPAAQTGPGLRIAFGCVALVLVLGVLAFVGFWAIGRVQQRGARPSMDPAQAAAVAQRIAAQHYPTIHRLVERTPGGVERTVCTAFSVRADLLATAARCVSTVEERRAQGSVFSLIGGDGVRVDIGPMYRHPAFVPGTPSPDVGLIRITGSPRAGLPLPSMADLAQVAVGDPCFLFEHPEGAPAATVVTGSITGFADLGPTGARQQVQCSAPGAAGAPVLDAQGRLVGIHVPAVAPPTDPGTGPGYAVRADVLLGLIAGLSG